MFRHLEACAGTDRDTHVLAMKQVAPAVKLEASKRMNFLVTEFEEEEQKRKKAERADYHG